MRKPLSARLQGRLSSSLQSLSLQQDRHIQQAWDAVIQVSARHLFCPAHSPTIPVSSIHSVPTGSRSYHFHRHHRPSSGSIDPSNMSGPHQIRAIHHQIGTMNKRQVRFGVTPHRSTPPITTNSVRHASTAALSIPPLFEDTPTQSSERCHSEPSPLSSSTSISDRTPQTPAPTLTPPTGSWRFPLQDTAKSSLKPVSPVQSWPSTSKALSTFYGSLHLARSPPSSCHRDGSESLPSSPLHLAVLNYNYLSRLQGLFDTVLVPRRDTRLLFLMQGREPKTEENLEQLLRIASDLIWLDRKEKQKRRQWSEVSEDGVTEESRGAVDASWSKPALSKIKQEFHGLRVSEYTVLMNWIGAATPRPVPSRKSCMDQQQQKDVNKPQSKETRSPLPPDLLPVDHAWAIWQDFLRTGMKPDVVMYTALMDRLLKAKQVEQADEIWQHMLQHQPSLSTAPKHQLNSPPISNKQKDHLRHSTKGKKGVVPNLQTFSVLMQNHVANRDLEGVVQTYRGLVAASGSGSGSSSSSSPPTKPSSGHYATTTNTNISTAIHENLSPLTMANTVLLNQILAALISLGESKAANDIFAEMQLTSGSDSPTSNRRAAPTTDVSGSPLTTPLHHQSFRRRFKSRKETSPGKDERSSPPTIQPDIRTYRLMLKLARRERDRELEKEILSYMTTNSK
ncbi:hypothetical protein BGZ93_005091 [Podila epicladia]|nr:hypothetical protein BGZ92_009635 [Podila epicladia]KAG0096034.1 hypothetical protein BGZ93_005091 [Podila epicladia]